MLEKKRTLLTMHEDQRTPDHVYFEYDAFAEEEVKPPYAYRVGYYMPLADWVSMDSPEQITVIAVPGNQMTNDNLKDEGVWDGGQVDWDIDNNVQTNHTPKHVETIKQDANGHATIITKENDA